MDIYSGMIDYNVLPRKELFIQDGLHMSGEGYSLLPKVLKPHLEE
ncbi:MAG: hypothetical protein QNK30_08790 [Bacteroidales bacterium]|nr:hypothetical protein [Bacteroidales bacterium]